MPDLHVESLRYRLEVDEAHGRFENPPPLDHETDAYRMRLEDGSLTVEMKEHHATAESARRRVEDDLKAWELDAALSREHAWLKFVYDPAGTKIIDREAPEPGQSVASCGVVLGRIVGAGRGIAEPAIYREYPNPSTSFAASPDVEIMISRFSKALYDDSQTLSFGYACLTWLEGSTDRTIRGKARTKAAMQYRIEEKVLDTLGVFTSRRGGLAEARKLDAFATLEPLTPDESAWLRSALKMLIRRKAAYDHDPAAAAALPMISMSDLPTLPGRSS